MRLAHIIICLLFGISQVMWAQKPVPIQAKSFFENDSLLQVRLTSDFTTLQRHRTSDSFYAGTIEIVKEKESILQEKVLVRNRGNMRRETCYPPPIMIDFKAINDSGSLKKLGKLKLVSSCADDTYSDQLLIREYLVYKMYELFTPLSFRTRLINIGYEDDKKANFSRPRYAFLLEDIDDLAKRNGCRETDSRFSTPLTDRKAATLFFIFQYMIGNTDWAIPLNRNLKLVYRKELPNSPPIPVPYDFDYSGIVNANYASPNEILPITHVRERYYMGFERTKEEITEALTIFKKNKMAIYNTIEACPYLAKDGKKDMINFLESFFTTIDHWDDAVEIFITNARKS